jgi:hypothetical protein
LIGEEKTHIGEKIGVAFGDEFCAIEMVRFLAGVKWFESSAGGE